MLLYTRDYVELGEGWEIWNEGSIGKRAGLYDRHRADHSGGDVHCLKHNR